ncbi:hypothetical protein BD414DRAFT_539383 [Trametes punicea]|nr:hypothetical protein BD414DRAFT_539383 [Trametes punicea]
MSTATVATSTLSAVAAASVSAKGEQVAFTRVTEKLLSIGAVPVADYLQEPAFAVPQNAFATVSQPIQPAVPATPETPVIRAVARLHQACQQTFGGTEALKFEFEEDIVSGGKRCKLTITRPNGALRTYSSSIAYQRKYDAKAHVSTVAIENGAIDFIVSGDGKGTPEAEMTPPSIQEADSASTLLEMDESVRAIEQTCLERTYGRIKAFWLIINEPKFGRTQGCALRIRLGPRNSRVWSVSTVYNSPAEAKKACAEAALADGILDYIRSWSPTAEHVVVDEPGSEFPNSSIGLQQFFDSLPRPFPEPVAGKTAVDINGPAWLNTTIQSARGGKIVPNFIWTVDPKLGFHGCLLRLERPGEVKSYLVDARFSKRAEAKAAVCLLAMSEGVGEYIRSVAKAVEDRLPPAMRKYVAEVLTPTLNAEYRKLHGPGIHPQIEYDMDLDACGATMTVELGPSPTPEQVRKYTVPAEYRNRNDAKLAVIAHAVEQGAIEFLRFKGRPPPPGYIPYYAQQHESYNMNRKRKNWDGGSGEWAGPGGVGSWQNNKKPRLGGGGRYGNYHGPSSATGFAPQSHHSGNQYQKPMWHGQKQQSWARPNTPGTGPFQSGPGNVGMPPPISAAPVPYSVGGGGPPVPPQPAPAPFAYSAAAIPPAQTPYPHTPQPHHSPYPSMPMQLPQYGAPNPGPGAFQPYYPQPAPPPPLALLAGPSGPLPYPYNAPYPGVPAQGQVSTYPSYPSAAPQYLAAPQPPMYYPPAGGAGPNSTVPIVHSPATYPAISSVPPGSRPPMPPTNIPYTPYQSPPAPQLSAQHSPPPPTPAVQPPTPATQPPPPPPTEQPPPPPQPTPPKTAPPPPPPPPSVVSSNKASNGAAKARPQSTVPAMTPPTPAPLTSSDRAAQNGKSMRGPKVTIAVASTPKTNVTALYDHCRTTGLPTPQFCHEILKGEQAGEPEHKVWVIIGKTKFELPVTFSSLSQGQEKVAKKVLDQLRHSKSDKAAAKPS